MIRHALRIGITQRRIPPADGSFARDALDADWSDWFARHWPRSRFIAIPNFQDPSHAVQYVHAWGIDLIILSGGEDVGMSAARDAVEHALLAEARRSALPVLGVCRGIQFLHVSTGGTLVRQAGHAGQPHIVHSETGALLVNSWHHWCIATPTSAWRVLARDADGCVEAMQHVDLPWLGMMWHPERAQGVQQAIWPWIEGIIARQRGTD